MYLLLLINRRDYITIHEIYKQRFDQLLANYLLNIFESLEHRGEGALEGGTRILVRICRLAIWRRASRT